MVVGCGMLVGCGKCVGALGVHGDYGSVLLGCGDLFGDAGSALGWECFGMRGRAAKLRRLPN